MNTNDFIEAIKIVVRDAAIEDSISLLESPPGRTPDKTTLDLSAFYNRQANDGKEMIDKIIESAVDEAIFGLLCVLDGVRAIENEDDKGTLDLYFTKSTSVHLNKDRDLHDIYN
ncbi:hypothetical protein [Pseudomonas fluorescens]|uniref:hypothetical protein n=1 Tax=Pseudomonas fluorescens TaxID=294 RepID=UPI00192B910D|nr:hypothetical protein [Pseudomonas fluorescens]MBL4979887.1 hypothetical protein [Pseudomonas fluorescens]